MRTLLAALRRLPPLESAIVAVALVLLVGLSVYEQRAAQPPPEVASFSSYEAGSSGYRAFYELLGREGARVERFERPLAFLDPGIDVLVFAQPLPFDPHAQRPTRADVTALAGWVRAGGRLLYLEDANASRTSENERTLSSSASRSVDESLRALLGPLGLPRTMPARSRAMGRFVSATLSAAGVAQVDTSSGWGSATARGVRYRVPRRGMSVLLDDGRGPLVVAYALGRGRVIAALCAGAFTNDAIAHGDNARLAVALASLRRRSAYVAFDETLHGFGAPLHWWQIVPSPFLGALALALVAFAMALFGAGVRLGPPLAAPSFSPAAPSDFIAALAALWQRGHAEAYALTTATASTMRLVTRAFGLPADAPPGDLFAHLRTEAERAACAELMQPATALRLRDERRFVRAIAAAQRLRKEYATRGAPGD